MDREERAILRASLSAWSARNQAALDAVEHGRWDAAGWNRLYQELDELGVLHILFDPTTRHDLGIVAEVADCLAAHHPSLALLVVQQNLAARLLGDAGAAPPVGWVALPLYDSAAEWPHQARVATGDRGHVVDGRWELMPGLPIAASAILPIAAAEHGQFALVQVSFADSPAGIARGATVRTLGLRGCPSADLTVTGARFSGTEVLASGPAARRAVEALWSQAEVLMLALRAGILARIYSVAREHAAVRWQGNKLIVEHSLVQRALADLYGARCAVEEGWRGMSAGLVVDQPLSAGQLSLSLDFAAELPRLASDGIQLLGGYGYTEELGQERLFRDAKQCEQLLGPVQARRFSSWRQEPR